MIPINTIYKIDCLKGMQLIDDKSINLIICDLPYGVTARNKWDIRIPFDKLWKHYKRIIKDNGVIVLTGTQPFASMLIMSNPKMFKYDLIWDKNLVTGFLNSKKMPLRKHETILIFYNKLPVYNPQMRIGKLIKKCTKSKQSTNYNDTSNRPKPYMSDKYYPTSILNIPNIRTKNSHPTQKPIKLFEYLIKTYSNEGDLVLDNCSGSGTTAIACINTNRNYICMDNSEKYCNIARERIKDIK